MARRLRADDDDEQGSLFAQLATGVRPVVAVEPTKRLSGVITVADIARRRGVGRTTAREWLLALDAKAGGTVVLRVNDSPRSKIYTTVARLHAADSGWVEAKEIEEDRLAALEKKFLEQQKELQLVKRRLRELLIAFRPDPGDDDSDRK